MGNRREFLGNVSHELKTPLFTVQGYLLTLLDGAIEDENVSKTIQKIKEIHSYDTPDIISIKIGPKINQIRGEKT